MKRTKLMVIAAIFVAVGSAFTTKEVANGNLIQLRKFDSNSPTTCVDDNVCQLTGHNACLWQSYSDQNCTTTVTSFRN